MSVQSEYALEKALIQQLASLEFEPIKIANEKEMLANLRLQLSKHNKNIDFTDLEFERVLAHLNSGSAFDRAKILRDRFALKRDNGDLAYIQFFDSEDWCLNEMQVSSQVSMEGKRKNRYDVTLLFNGLPLVQIELKRRGSELKVAYNQINRYHHESYDAGYALFQYVQIFIISNGVNTRYFANNRDLSYQFTFSWADIDNNKISDLHEFTNEFLKPCHISKMISHYMVINETEKSLMVMRPYQVYATEALVTKVKESNTNGYIWHSTGSGKTLTAFKASQIIMNMPKVQKVLFVVDRKDLDYQTAEEFNNFSEGSVDTTTNTRHLVKQLNDPNTKLIVTTLQKLNNAIRHKNHLAKIKQLQNEKIVLIFDECHRSQFGETHRRIKAFFKEAQLFGFTGTPIFFDNAISYEGLAQTTTNLFDECLHKYVIVDAIRDQNVLPFSVEYISLVPVQEQSVPNDSANGVGKLKAAYEHPDRIEKIVEYILNIHKKKTRYPDFTAVLCASSIDAVIEYYNKFKEKQKGLDNPLKIASIFSYAANPEIENNQISESKGYIPDEDIDSLNPKHINKSHRDWLDIFISDYNKLFQCGHSANDSQSYYNYYNDIARRVKRREIHILLVVNMFLTGFDSKYLNTLYVDKNLRYHGLIQAFSRTNRTLSEKKSHGNIVCFRDLKEETDEAITLFSNKDAKDTVLVLPYEEYVELYNNAVALVLKLTPKVQDVDLLEDEEAELDFIKQFRELLRLNNILRTFVDFNPEDLDLPPQDFEDLKSKYLDLYEKHKTKRKGEDESIIDEIDFELELIHRDEINVAYILALLSKLLQTEGTDQFNVLKEEIFNKLNTEVQLRGKRDLIKRFMDKYLTLKPTEESLEEVFVDYIEKNRSQAFKDLCTEEKLNFEAFNKLLENYITFERLPRQEEIIQSLEEKISILVEKETYERISTKLNNFIDTYVDGFGGLM